MAGKDYLLSKISTLVFTTGVACIIVWRTLKWIDKKASASKRSKNDKLNSDNDYSRQYIHTKNVVIVDTAEDWDVAYNQLKDDLMAKKVLGMDCEWVGKNKVALLQLCSANGFCVLVRLFKLKPPYPGTFISVLSDRSILKTGVAVVDDGNKLHRDYGLSVYGCVDLRHMMHRMKIHSDSFGLKGLASKVLCVDMNKDTRIRCSNWEADSYTEEQINYAAGDAAVGVDIFVQLVLQKMMKPRKTTNSSYLPLTDNVPLDAESTIRKDVKNTSINESDSYCGPLSCSISDKFDIERRNSELPHTSYNSNSETESKVTVSDGENLKGNEGSVSKTENCLDDAAMKSADKGTDSSADDVEFWRMACSLCQGLLDVGYNFNKTKEGQSSASTKKSTNKKDVTASYSKRQRPLWDNCRLQAPDGSVLCTCDVRKAQWYLDKDLGDKVSDDPFTVRLRFEPSNKPQNERNYYLQEKENQCVVCGDDREYVRKFVIPYEYKKHFPSALKDHSSHDVLLLCISCHKESCDFDSKFRLQLAAECDAPVESGATSKTVLDHDLQKVRSAGRALKFNRNSIPEKRLKELEQTLLNFFGVNVVSDDLIEQGAEIDARQTADGYVPHGKRVVRHMARNGGLLAFQARWRQHFLDTMNPRCLPAFWSVDYVPEGWSGLQMSS